jgi:hypothetical protein
LHNKQYYVKIPVPIKLHLLTRLKEELRMLSNWKKGRYKIFPATRRENAKALLSPSKQNPLALPFKILIFYLPQFLHPT